VERTNRLPYARSVVARRTPVPAALEPLAPEQRGAVDAWERGGRVDSPEVAALRKRLRGEALTPAEEALLTARARKPAAVTVPHEDVLRELADRKRRGG
jgi:hypothetical protein